MNSNNIFVDNSYANLIRSIDKNKKPNTNQIACPICLNPGNMLDIIKKNNLFIRLECGNLVCFECWKYWKLNGYKCPVCNVRSHAEQEILLSREEFTELYSDYYNKYIGENKITAILNAMGIINHNFIPDKKKVQMEDIEIELHQLKFFENEIKNDIMIQEMKYDDFSPNIISNLFEKLFKMEERINFLNNKLFELEPKKIIEKRKNQYNNAWELQYTQSKKIQ